ncbi:heme ABC transporter ATP-binding protein [Flavitalea sp.]|nr:heme ABC transporter ATP-binding protein [Flavitalea sp.]
MLRTENISYKIGNRKILEDINIEFHAGEFNMILGPNGSGKSTFFRIFSGEIQGYTGRVCYNEKVLRKQQLRELARHRAVMSQQPDLSFPLTVDEVVMMGRYPHFDFNPSPKDNSICNDVIERLRLTDFKERNYLTLSGGEKQRVQYARVLAQIWERPKEGNRYLFLDEPLNNLDISYQQEFLRIAREFTGNDTIVIAVIHDINLALQYADKLFFFKNGRLNAHGNTMEVLTADLIADVFNVSVTLINNAVTKRPLLVYN